MISTDLLARLQKADNVTLERVCQTAVGEYESFDGDGFEVKYTVSYEELFDDAKEAWLQHCIQAAIRARGWHLYQIRNDDLPGLPCFADIIILGHGKEHDIHHEGEGSTEAEALCRAYLAAIQEAA